MSYTVSISVELELERNGQLLWSSGPVAGLQGFVVGQSPYETSIARTAALEGAVQRALSIALKLMEHREPAVVSPS